MTFCGHQRSVKTDALAPIRFPDTRHIVNHREMVCRLAGIWFSICDQWLPSLWIPLLCCRNCTDSITNTLRTGKWQ